MRTRRSSLSSARCDTRLRLLDAVERLFAQRGFEGTSIRAVTREAGASLSAANYHFGSKEALIHAALARRIEPINRRRLELLDALDTGGQEMGEDGVPPGIHGLLDAFLRPALEECEYDGEGAARIGQIAARLHSDPHPAVVSLEAALFGEVSARFIAAFAQMLPGQGLEVVQLRFHFMLGSFAHCLVSHSSILGAEALLEEMVAYAAAGFACDQPARAGAGE